MKKNYIKPVVMTHHIRIKINILVGSNENIEVGGEDDGIGISD